MARAPAAPQIESVSRPVYGGGQSDDMTSFAGDLLNYSNSQAILGANEGRFADYQRRQDYADNQELAMQQAQLREQTIKDTARKTPVELMREEAEVLKERMNLFNMAAQLKSATMQQDAREADYQLAEPLAQLASYVGTQNWGSVYAQRKALVANPLYAKSREVRARLEAIDQMLPSWGSAYNSRGESRNFMDVAKEAESPDWATRKEALRILALKSENAQGFVFSHPNLTPTQSAELLTFIRANPLVSDEMKIGQLRQFEQTFNQKLLESTGGDYQEFLRQLGSPETQRQKQDAARALLYGKGSDEPNYVDSSDRVLDGESLDHLNEFINMKIDNDAGVLSLTRAAREVYTHGRRLFDKDYGTLTPEEMVEVTSNNALERATDDPEFINQVSQAVVAGGAVGLGKFVDDVARLKKLIGTTGLSAADEAEMVALASGKWTEKAAGLASGKLSKVMPKIFAAARASGKGIKAVASMPLMSQAIGGVLKKVGTNNIVSGVANKIGTKAAAVIGAKGAAKVAGTALGLGLDAAFFYKDAWADMSKISDGIKSIKTAQTILQGAAARQEAPAEMQGIMEGLMRDIQNINIISERHGLGIKLDLNNVVSKQMAYRLQGKKALDQTMSEVYGVPQMPDPRKEMRVQYQPQQPTVAVGPGVSADPWAAMGQVTPQ